MPMSYLPPVPGRGTLHRQHTSLDVCRVSMCVRVCVRVCVYVCVCVCVRVYVCVCVWV